MGAGCAHHWVNCGRRHVLPAPKHRIGCRPRRHAHRLGNRRCGHALRGIRLPYSGGPPTQLGFWRLRLRARWLGRFHRLPLRLGLLARFRDRAGGLRHLILLYARPLRTFPAGALDCGNRGLVSHLADFLHPVEGRAAGCGTEHGDHGGQDCADPELHCVVAFLGFSWDKFTFDFWGHESGDVFTQVQGVMLFTVWVFIGVEGASVYSRQSRSRKDVSRATLIGFFSVLALLVSISVLSFGVMSTAELAALPDNSMAAVLEAVVGPWGGALVSFGLCLSVLGAYVSWQMLCAEPITMMARDGLLPARLSTISPTGAPIPAQLVSTIVIQALIIVFFLNETTYVSMVQLATVAYLVPYLFSAIYLLLLAVRGRGLVGGPGVKVSGRDNVRHGVVAAIAVILCPVAVLRRRPEVHPLRRTRRASGPDPLCVDSPGSWPENVRRRRVATACDRGRRRRMGCLWLSDGRHHPLNVKLSYDPPAALPRVGFSMRASRGKRRAESEYAPQGDAQYGRHRPCIGLLLPSRGRRVFP